MRLSVARVRQSAAEMPTVWDTDQPGEALVILESG